MLKPSIKTITVKTLLSVMVLGVVVVAVIIAFNFRMLSHNIVKNKAMAIAELVKAGLTAHMKGGIMDQRDYFLEEIKTLHAVKQISIIRSPEVNRQFGSGRLEKEMTPLVQEAFSTRMPVYVVDDFVVTPVVRAVVPYIASSRGKLNCLGCHKVEEGTVLGAVDIELDITGYRTMASWLLMVVLVVVLLFILLVVFNTIRTMQVYVQEPLEILIERAKVAYERHEPVNTERFYTQEFENIAREINLFNTDIIANQGLLKDMNNNLMDLNNEIEETLRETIFTMGVIEEQRSREARNHTKRVTEYSRLLAVKLGLSEQEVELVAAASPLHDIGKVGMPDNILFKHGKLSEDEYKIMKGHTSIGYSMLAHSERALLKMAAVIAYQHHEKWDGSGYPCGLKGKGIHVFGRLVALADVFDSLLSERTYKNAWPMEKVVEWIVHERGRHFDPELVDLLVNNIDEFVAMGERYGYTVSSHPGVPSV